MAAIRLIENSSHSEMALYCPAFGLEVDTKSEWLNQKVSQTFESNFWVIGKSIVYSRPKGFADAEGVKQSLVLNDQVAGTLRNGIGSYVQIEDYTFLHGSSAEARKYFTNRFNENPRRSSIIFCNASLHEADHHLKTFKNPEVRSRWQ
jgi:hypothetical protein